MSEEHKYRILIIDDHPLIRSGIISEIQKLAAFEKTDSAGSIQEANALISRNEYDIIVCDLSLPDGKGMNLLQTIRKNNDRIKLAVLTMHRDWNHLAEAKGSNLNGYLLKENSTESIASSILLILHGNDIFPEESIPDLAIQEKSDLLKKYDTLTDREKDVLKHLVNGFLNKEIAEKLNLSTRTVESHRASLMKKLEAKNSISLATYKQILH